MDKLDRDQMIENFRGGFKKHLKDENPVMNTAFFYALYPYKKQAKATNTVYIKKSLLSDHKFSLSFEEYCELKSIYLEERMNYIRDGFRYIFLSNIGELVLVKYKLSESKKKSYIKYAKKLRKTGLYKNEHEVQTQLYKDLDIIPTPLADYHHGYYLRLLWRRRKFGKVIYKHWVYKPMTASTTSKSNFCTSILNYYKINPHKLSNLKTITTYAVPTSK